MNTIEVAGQTYQVNEMPAMKQAHVVRRLLPLADILMDIVGNLRERPAGSVDAAGTFKAFAPLLKAIGTLSDADAEFIFQACLAATSRQQGAGWAATWPVGQTRPMFQDIGALEMYEITGRVLFDLFGKHIAAKLGADPAGAAV